MYWNNVKQSHLLLGAVLLCVLFFTFRTKPVPANTDDDNLSVYDPQHPLYPDIIPNIQISAAERAIPTEELLEMLSVAVEKGHELRTKKISTILLQVAHAKKQAKDKKKKPSGNGSSSSGEQDTIDKPSKKGSKPGTNPKSKTSKPKPQAKPKPPTKTGSGKDQDYMDGDSTLLPSGYVKRSGWQLAEHAFMSAPGCVDLGGQCSTPKDKAEELCNSIDKCLGFTCNRGRDDCQLRVAPLKHETSGNFDAFYKPGQLAATVEGMAAREREWQSKMEPGHLAAKDWNPDGVCGEDGYKCVISYGLYGDNPKYTEGAITNAELAPKIFPGWVVRIYHDNTVPQSILDRLKKLGCEFVKIENITGGIAGMFWRFLVAEDDTVDRYIVRDSDSRLNEREAAAVNEWIESKFSVHSIRDHPNHNRPLNGGMWGGVKGSVKNIRSLIMNSSRGNYGADLDFLNDKVWPQIQYDQISHDSYSCQSYINAKPFPTKRENYQHVGQVFENGQPRQSDITCCLIHNHAPKACRKKEEWLYG